MSPADCGSTRRLIPVLAVSLLLAVVGCGEDAESPTSPQEPTAPALATEVVGGALVFRQVSEGAVHTCGVTKDDVAYCWGFNYYGQLGDGTITDRYTPVAVTGGLRFRHVSAGSDYTCGITTDNLAYCWGDRQYGELGDGTTSDDFRRLTPFAVVGGRLFAFVRAGHFHTCAVTSAGVAFCWGLNDFGQLGDGTEYYARNSPVPVAGGLTFSRVVPGTDHTCGWTTANKAYCWGQNDEGQLGDGTTTQRVTPTAVLGSRRFHQVVAGGSHTCGVTTSNVAYCWGRNRWGQLGDGTQTRRLGPVVVAGGHQFDGLAAGAEHSCGVTTGGVAYCWGHNTDGQLGVGSDAVRRVRPTAVAGGLHFNGVSAGADSRHTCGVTTDDRAYCWGWNFRGQLGDGTTTSRRTPVAVAGAM
jgi:alpha-tubulin suppressor-like RCC1 family protein